jgi:hypothetical protein
MDVKKNMVTKTVERVRWSPKFSKGFVVSEVSRADVAQALDDGKMCSGPEANRIAAKMDDSDMRNLASKMGEGMGDDYWNLIRDWMESRGKI